jgi:hypothetical protein
VRAFLDDYASHPAIAFVARHVAWDALEAAADELWEEAEQLAFDLLEQEEPR